MTYAFKLKELVHVPSLNCDAVVQSKTHGRYRVYVRFKPNDPNKYPGGNVRCLDESQLVKK